jgi:uncharacterized YigZ family protein
MSEIYLPIENTYQYVIEKSKFIAYVYYFDDKSKLQDILKSIKREHLSATHIVYAYRCFEDNIADFRDKQLDKYMQSYFDDGEPSGTGGAPILRAIEEANLSNVLIAVVRYFGGIKLGIPGLTKAYKQAAIGAIENKTKLTLKDVFALKITYPELNGVLTYCEKNGVITDKKFEEFAEFNFATENKEAFLTACEGKCEINYLGKKYL